MSPDGLKQAVEERVREKLPAIQSAIQSQTGKKLPDSVLFDMLADPMTEVVATEVTVQSSSQYAGPMPSPQHMRDYARIYPGAPEQLFRQFELEQKHRHAWEDRALSHTNGERRRRDLGAYAIAIAGLAVAFYLASLGAHIPAAILAGTIVLGGGALFLGRQLFASHGKEGTQLSIQEDGSNSHRAVNTKKASSRRRRSNGAK